MVISILSAISLCATRFEIHTQYKLLEHRDAKTVRRYTKVHNHGQVKTSHQQYRAAHCKS